MIFASESNQSAGSSPEPCGAEIEPGQVGGLREIALHPGAAAGGGGAQPLTEQLPVRPEPGYAAIEPGVPFG